MSNPISDIEEQIRLINEEAAEISRKVDSTTSDYLDIMKNLLKVQAEMCDGSEYTITHLYLSTVEKLAGATETLIEKPEDLPDDLRAKFTETVNFAIQNSLETLGDKSESEVQKRLELAHEKMRAKFNP